MRSGVIHVESNLRQRLARLKWVVLLEQLAHGHEDLLGVGTDVIVGGLVLPCSPRENAIRQVHAGHGSTSPINSSMRDRSTWRQSCVPHV
jgi:hypothetical protein